MVERRDTRVTAGVGVILTIDGKPAPCMTRNLSRGGMFAVTKRQAAPGTQVGLEVVHQGTRLRARAEVVQQTPQGLGLRFVDVDDQFRTAIRALMDALVAEQAAQAGDFDDVDDGGRLEMAWAWPGQKSGWKFWKKSRYDVAIANLNVDGGAFKCAERPGVGDAVVMIILGKKDDAGQPLTCQAEVVRHTDDGFAVRFVTPSIDFRRAIAEARRAKFKSK